LVKENPRASYRSIQKLWNKGSPPSISTISEWKNKLGVKDYSDHIQHQLTEEQKEKRVKIAKLHKGKLKKKSVMFVDETSCSNQFIHHRLHVLPGEEPDYTKLIKEKRSLWSFLCWNFLQFKIGFIWLLQEVQFRRLSKSVRNCCDT